MSESRKTVLFIDDDADVRKTAQLLLEKRGYIFYGAENPDIALSRIVSVPVDVILLDLNFSKGQTSGVEGLNCLRDILRHDPRANVIVVTGHAQADVETALARIGVLVVATRKPLAHAHMVSGADTPSMRRPLRTTCCAASASAMRALRS
ncbi:MAG: response regulator, partial [Asticcacaulis sp.]